MVKFNATINSRNLNGNKEYSSFDDFVKTLKMVLKEAKRGDFFTFNVSDIDQNRGKKIK